MEQEDYETAIRQLRAAAELVAAGVSENERMNAQGVRAFFMMKEARVHEANRTQTSNDDLFRATASAALEMAGRKEYLAAAALLEQARSLI
ncbi:hypothetical protein [Caballeronia sp. BR00000012568055]|uniref:hypothetical protein n=1 Tax=Caballeronia sp. BR00000012568055 TaxID=2918761 RepID=UPI0023F96F86|nr:hypothetical protein [Caballeronia sp. BR00000012568055]